MSKIYTINENQYFKLFKNLINEDYLDRYDDMDYFEALVSIFRKWLIDNGYENELKKFPFSYLIRKHSYDFLVDLIGEEETENIGGSDGEYIHRWNINRIIKKIIEKGKFSFLRVDSGYKFTEKFKKQLDFFVQNLDLPDFMTLSIDEKNPYELTLEYEVDFPKMLKSQNKKRFDERSLERKLENNIKNYLGIDIGNPIFGELSIETDGVSLVGEEEWAKTELKKIRKEIRTLPSSENIHSITYERDENGVILRIRYKSESPYGIRSNLKKSVKDLIEKMGYSADRIKIGD